MKRKKSLILISIVSWLVSLLIAYIILIKDSEILYAVIGIIISLLAAILAFVQIFPLFHKTYYKRQLSGENVESIGLAGLRQISIPIVLVQKNGEIFWYNDMFYSIFLGKKSPKVKSLEELLHFDFSVLQKNQEIILEFEDLSYRVNGTVFQENGMDLVAVQFMEVTELIQLQSDYEDSKPCVLLLVIDSYDDVLQYSKESEKAQVSAEVERVLETFMTGTNGILRKIDNDMFYAVMETRYLHSIMQDKFKILDDSRKILVNGRIHITFSIGVGFGAVSLEESEKYARQSLDMALGRGGDQAAVKTENGFIFFGGVSKGVEKKSKTKIRSVAQALQELIENSDQVFLMGHRFGDLDAIGSACGLAGAIHMMHKDSYVVVNQKNCLAIQLIEKMKNCELPPKFIEPEKAIEQVTENSLLIIVDTHNKDILENVDLYNACKYVAVIDHHRKNVNFIEDAVIFHHEPYASSASEMVTEIIQYFRLDEEILSPYADALLAGITLDTKNFVMRTGVRTFEAAAYLRKVGADTVQVKSLFSSTISMYQLRSQIVAHAEIYRTNAISAVKIQNSDTRVLAAQAADELLGIQGVEASFVLFLEQNGVGISARSLGNVNVQLIMEKLGGGGHQTMAAAQIPDITLQEAKEKLLFVLEDKEDCNES